MNRRVYLAGPISGHDYDEAEGWRSEARLALRLAGIDAFSPLRGDEVLRGKGQIEGSYGDLTPLLSRKAMTTRDRNDVCKADVVLVNLLGSGDRVSIGSVMEVAWADAARVPVVLVAAPGNVHRRHPMFLECCGFVADDLPMGLEVVKSILLSDFG